MCGRTEKFHNYRKFWKRSLEEPRYSVDCLRSSTSALRSDRPECMIRQNLFPAGAMIRFGTPPLLFSPPPNSVARESYRSTFPSGDFFLRDRVTFLPFFFFLSQASPRKSLNPLEICLQAGEWRRRTARYTTAKSEKERVSWGSTQVFRLVFRARSSRAQRRENCITKIRWIRLTFFFFPLGFSIIRDKHMSENCGDCKVLLCFFLASRNQIFSSAASSCE